MAGVVFRLSQSFRLGASPGLYPLDSSSLIGYVCRSQFTPTCVGTKAASRAACAASSVHPHARGDDKYLAVVAYNSPGSPPRAWGRRGNRIRIFLQPRFTPTRVGTTLKSCLAMTRTSVHPHASGDDRVSNGGSTCGNGSPPRAWGRPWASAASRLSARFTPTRVGTTWPPRWRKWLAAVHPHARGDDTNETRTAPGFLQAQGVLVSLQQLLIRPH